MSAVIDLPKGGRLISYDGPTESGFIGSPVFSSNSIVGLHGGKLHDTLKYYATAITTPIQEWMRCVFSCLVAEQQLEAQYNWLEMKKKELQAERIRYNKTEVCKRTNHCRLSFPVLYQNKASNPTGTCGAGEGNEQTNYQSFTSEEDLLFNAC